MMRLMLFLCMAQISLNAGGELECLAEEGSMITLKCMISLRRAAQSFTWIQKSAVSVDPHAACFLNDMKCDTSGFINQVNVTKINASDAASFFTIPSVKRSDQGLWICSSGSQTVHVCDLKVSGATANVSLSTLHSQTSKKETLLLNRATAAISTTISVTPETRASAGAEVTETISSDMKLSISDPGTINSVNLSAEDFSETGHAPLKMIIASAVMVAAVSIIIFMLILKLRGCKLKRITAYDSPGVTKPLTAPYSREPTDGIHYYIECV